MIHRHFREDGQGLAEYALILVLVAVAVIAILTLFGEELALFYQNALDRLSEVLA